MAGLTRMWYPTIIRIIRVMYSDRVDPEFILDAFHRGIDGVFIGRLHPEHCHYVEGNDRTQRRISLLKEFLRSMNINPERFRLEWVSTNKGEKFTKVVKDFVTKLKELGSFNGSVTKQRIQK